MSSRTRRQNARLRQLQRRDEEEEKTMARLKHVVPLRAAPEPQVNVWDELSRRFYGADRDFLKRVVHIALYGGSTDPWLDRMVTDELAAIYSSEGTYR